MKLNWNGINKISDKEKEVIEDALTQKGEIALRLTFMGFTIAEKLAKNNKLTLDLVRIQCKGRSILHYVFRIDSQQRLRDKLIKKQRLRYWLYVALIFILAFIVSLWTQVIFWR